jgi:hypothetical protein
LPSIFSKFKFYELSDGSAPDSDHVPIPGVSPRAPSIAETVLYESDKPSSVKDVFDSDGFPLLANTIDNSPPNDDEGLQAAGESDFQVEPLNPNPKRRKSDVLSCRKTTKTTTPMKTAKAKAKASPQKLDAPAQAKAKVAGGAKAKATATSLEKNSLVLFGPRLACTTEINPRAELTAYVQISGKSVRVHVCTATFGSWGPRYSSDLLNIKTLILEGTVSKDVCLTLRDELKLAASAVNVD